MEFERYGDRNGNKIYRTILKEKIRKGEPNELLIPKRIQIVDENDSTVFLLTEECLKPKSLKIAVEDYDKDTMKISLRFPPSFKGLPTIKKTILDSLAKLKAFLQFSKKEGHFEYDPHQ